MYARRLSLGVLSAGACLVALRLAGVAQSLPPQPSPPTFRSTVDLLTLDASVRDRRGEPVPDLQASDFTVTIDGRPRKVVSAVFFKSDAATGGRMSGGAAPTPRHVSNDGTLPGRVIVFAIDSESIRRDQEKALFEAASRTLDRLSAADAVGLIELPGPSIEVTRDHSSVAEALRRFTGRARGEAATLAEGSNILLTERAHTQQVLSDLARLLRRMAPVQAPRSVILISGGLVFEPELMSEYTELQRAAAESRVMLYTVLLQQVGYDVSRGETRPDVAVDPALAVGLGNIASMTGGMFFTGIAGSVGVFDRIASEVSSFYQLGLESSPADADGKQRDVKVRVSRTGLDVRAASHVAVPRPPKAAPRDPLAVALQQPTDVPDVPLAVTTYSTYPSGNAIPLLISVEIGAPSGVAPAEWGVSLTQNGKDVVTRRGRIPAGSERPRVVSTTVEVPPGDYRLRVAAVDAEDHIGVLETSFTAGYETTAGTVLSDLIVGVATGGQLEPRRRIARLEQLTAMLEVLPAAGAVPGGTLQLIPGGGTRSVLSTPLSIRPASSAGAPATLQASASLAAVPPGRYTASAALEIAGQPLTRISRVVEITEAVPATTQPDVVAAPTAETPLATSAPTPTRAPAPAETSPAGSPDEIVRRAGAYVEHYGGQASLLVGIEHYLQSVTRTAVIMPGSRGGLGGLGGNAAAGNIAGASPPVTERRRLVSEFALAPNRSVSGGWLGYRDVIEMDGKPIGDRRDRLEALFRSDAPDFEAARRIVDEGARYNIGPVSRNFNVPTTTLFFFHTGNLPRFTFRRKGRERIDGLDTVVLEFHEARSPTLIMNGRGKDVPSSGMLWINPVDGAIVRSRLELGGFDDAGSKAVIDVLYLRDKALGMWVPSRMTERYSGGSRDVTTTVATYSDFKRFQTSVKIK